MKQWLDISQVGRLQLEITNYCNAACPLCVRNKITKENVNSHRLSFTNIKEWFRHYNWSLLERVHLCGNVDEPTLNPDIFEIIEFFKGLNSKLDIWVATNGGTRNKKFWQELGKISDNGRVKVIFGIDGLEDTNHIYRKNVKWNKLQNNFKNYISNGGYAAWQFIPFQHNFHQIEEARIRARSEGFKNFNVKSSYNKETDTVKPYFNETIQEKIKIEDRVICSARPNSHRAAFHPTLGSLYFTSRGYCLPCCWMGTPKEISDLKKITDSNLDDINLYKNSLIDVLKSETFLTIKNNLQTYNLCVKKCKKENKPRYFTIPCKFKVKKNGKSRKF